jgi:Bacterial archaeo-eukaryotic release factor family 3
MTITEGTKTAAVRELLRVPGPCITVVLAGNEVGDTAIELKQAVTAIRGELRIRGGDSESLVKPIVATGAQVRGETKARGSIVILRSPEVMEVHRARGLGSLVRVDDHFDVRTVLAFEAAHKSFYILALSQKRTRILKCTQDAAEEVPFPAGFPYNLADAMQTRQPDHMLDNRSSGGPSIGAGTVVFGMSSDREAKDEYLLHFFKGIDRAVRVALNGSEEPLVPAGVEHEIALYRRVNTYPELVEPGVHGAPDGLEGGEMHRRAVQVLEEREQEPGRVVPADFDRRVSAGLASTHIQEIVQAAFAGRISQLFFQANAQYQGAYDRVWQKVKRTEDPHESPVDLIEIAAYQTILQGGEARIVAGRAMPKGVPLCAIFRYAA